MPVTSILSLRNSWATVARIDTQVPVAYNAIGTTVGTVGRAVGEGAAMKVTIFTNPT